MNSFSLPGFLFFPKKKQTNKKEKKLKQTKNPPKMKNKNKTK